MSNVRNLVVISDTHCGDGLGLCPPDSVHLDDGGTYRPSRFQREVYGLWREFWASWVPSVVRKEPWDLVHNGDAIDGVHQGFNEKCMDCGESSGTRGSRASSARSQWIWSITATPSTASIKVSTRSVWTVARVLGLVGPERRPQGASGSGP